MDLEDLTAVLSLFDRNVKKVQQNLIDYKHDVDAVRQSLVESWAHVARADGRIISVHDGLLSSVNDVNEHVIKLNLHINLNRAVGNLKYVRTMENICKQDRESLEHNNNKENHTNRDGIEVGELDVQPSTSKESPPRTMDVHQLMELNTSPVKAKLKSQNPVDQMSTPVVPMAVHEKPKFIHGSNSAEPVHSTALQETSNSAELIARRVLHIPAEEMFDSANSSNSVDHMSTPVLPMVVNEKLNSTNGSNSAELIARPVLPIPAEEMLDSAEQMFASVLPTPEKISNSANDSHSPEQMFKPVLPIPAEEMLDSANSSAEQMFASVLPTPEIITNSPEQMFKPVLPISPRKSDLLAPKGGREMSSNEIYDQVLKNISNFPNNSIVRAKMMHINILEKCIFVAKWGAESTRLRKLMACEIPVKQLDQLPDFGEIFGVYDSQDQIILRVLINAHTEGGGYDAYLLDYGEHIHLNGNEVIFGLPDDVVALPAEAIRCYVENNNVDYMRQFIYKDVRLHILCNDGFHLEVELLEDDVQLENQINTNSQQEKDNKEQVESTRKLSQSNEQDVESIKSTMKLSQREMEMLEYNEPSTCDAVKAVLGFNPTDDMRICRHYDPKTGGCFKGSNCRLLHQPFAPHGATKDKELTEALPETQYESSMTRELGSVVRVVVTYINGPTQVYVQFADETSALVWSKNDVPESERRFKRAPLPLDMVLALYDDGYYYRAQIIEECDGTFKIFYVDYGNTEFVTIRSLAQCNNARSLKPHRAVSCFIAGIQRVPSASPGRANECVEFLKSNLLNCEINVKLMSHLPDGYVIKLLDSHADICNQMFEHGYMEIRTENGTV
ncbi:hypothetical protein ACLKA6_006874 [Drosophila palustris]